MLLLSVLDFFEAYLDRFQVSNSAPDQWMFVQNVPELIVASMLRSGMDYVFLEYSSYGESTQQTYLTITTKRVLQSGVAVF